MGTIMDDEDEIRAFVDLYRQTSPRVECAR